MESDRYRPCWQLVTRSRQELDRYLSITVKSSRGHYQRNIIEESIDPRQSHSDPVHPRTKFLPIFNGVDDLEVALYSPDYLSRSRARSSWITCHFNWLNSDFWVHAFSRRHVDIGSWSSARQSLPPGWQSTLRCWPKSKYSPECLSYKTQDNLALASMARDDSPASSTVAAMCGKVGSEFET